MIEKEALDIPLRLEIPKSEILQIPLGSTRMLSAFTSYESLASVFTTRKVHLKGTYSVNDLVVMQVRKTIDHHARKRLDSILGEFPMFAQTASDGSTGHVLEEYAEELLRLLESEVLDDVRMIEGF